MGHRVLLAEDEPHIIELVGFLLAREGFSVETAATGTDALDKALANPPDVLVLDLMLPGLTGFELIRRIRADAATRRVPVLMLTAKGQREDRREAERLGVDIFLTKPFANADLIAAVSQLANGRAA